MFKKLKSLFIVNEGGDNKGAEAKSPQDPKSTPPVEVKRVSVSSINVDANASSKFVDVLLKAIEANNMEGFDYLEYKQSLQNLSKMAMDEQTRYQSAYAMAQTMGVTPVMLKQSAEHYVKILKDEQSKFAQALKNQKNKQITEKQKAITQLEGVIRQKENQIVSLKAELSQHAKQLVTHKKNISVAAEKVEKTRINFEGAYNSVMGQIKDDLEKMKQYLK